MKNSAKINKQGQCRGFFSESDLKIQRFQNEIFEKKIFPKILTYFYYKNDTNIGFFFLGIFKVKFFLNKKLFDFRNKVSTHFEAYKMTKTMKGVKVRPECRI